MVWMPLYNHSFGNLGSGSLMNAGSNLSSMGIMALVALTGMVRVSLALYQGKPVFFKKA